MRTDDPRDRHGSNALHAPQPQKACCRICSQVKQTLMVTVITGITTGSHYEPRKAHQMWRARHKSGQRVHLVNHVNRAHRESPAFSVLREWKLLPTPTVQPSRTVQPLSPTTVLQASMALI